MQSAYCAPAKPSDPLAGWLLAWNPLAIRTELTDFNLLARALAVWQFCRLRDELANGLEDTRC